MPGRNGRAAQFLLLLAVGAVAVALGALTAYAQGWLPEQAASLANSSGPWALVAFSLALLAPRRAAAVASAVLALVALVAGYYAAHEFRGFESSKRVIAFWGLAAVLAGPPLGLAASWVRNASPMLAAVGIGMPAGVLIGEGIYGLRTIADTAYPPYWWRDRPRGRPRVRDGGDPLAKPTPHHRVARHRAHGGGRVRRHRQPEPRVGLTAAARACCASPRPRVER